jgi:hypothetical protein
VSLIVDEHREYLSDPVRLSAFKRAIGEVVRPGAVVLDLASGTGILGLLACEAGARRVYSVEVTGMVEVARSVAAANGFGERVVVLQGLSSQMTLPEQVDVIVCDQIGRFGFEAGIVGYGSDARNRFLRPGGTMLPGRVDLILAPIEAAAAFGRVQFWDERPGGFDFGPARQWAANTGYPTAFGADALLGPAHVAASLDMTTVEPRTFVLRQDLEIARRGVVHGVGGWFDAQLSPSVTLTNAPTATSRINRRNVFFPIERAVPVEPGDVVAVDMRILPPTTVNWTVDIRRGAASLGRFRHSTLKGMLVSRDDLRRMNPDSVPSLTDRGLARLSVLELCDGMRCLADIEREMHARHPDLFSSASDAGAFVAEVVTRYSR